MSPVVSERTKYSRALFQETISSLMLLGRQWAYLLVILLLLQPPPCFSKTLWWSTYTIEKL